MSAFLNRGISAQEAGDQDFGTLDIAPVEEFVNALVLFHAAHTSKSCAAYYSDKPRIKITRARCWSHARYGDTDFAARIRNPNTRQAYFRAVNRFSQWCTLRNLELTKLNPVVIARYIEELQGELGVTSVKQHLSAIRMLFDYLVTGHIVPFNPAQAVQAPRYSASEGKTPILSAQETRQLLDAIDITNVWGLRNRALIGVLVFSCARVSAVVGMKLEDY
ncbi:MAG: site-specific integrase, partial [Chloroflexota bacterium]